MQREPVLQLLRQLEQAEKRYQVGLIAVTYLGMVYSGLRIWFGDSGNLSAWLVNVLWASYNVVMISGLVWAAFWKPEEDLPEQSGVAPSATEAK